MVKIPSIAREVSRRGGGEGVIVMNTSRIQEVLFSVSYSRWYTSQNLDVSDTDEAPAKKVGSL